MALKQKTIQNKNNANWAYVVYSFGGIPFIANCVL